MNAESGTSVSGDEIALFRQRLLEAAAWCDLRAEPWHGGETLRSEELRPSELLSAIEASPGVARRLVTDFLRERLVETVCRRRAQLLRQRQVTASKSDDPVALPRGRVVAFWPDETLSDGAAEVGSDEYFNQENEPPWDCWLWYEQGTTRRSDGLRSALWRPIAGRPDPWLDGRYLNTDFLVAWVPQSLEERVNRGILWNPEGCIDWLDYLDTPFTRALRAAGLLGPLPS